MRLRHRVWSAAITAASVSILLVTPTGAQAAAPEELCSDFSYSKTWSTSRNWARLSYQNCMIFTGTSVQPKVRVRFDWPVPCQALINFPPRVTGSCPLVDITKNPLLTFQRNGAGFAFATPWTVTAPNGGKASRVCKWANGFTVDSAIAQGRSRLYLTCTSSVKYTRTRGTWTMTTTGVRGDVKDDGRGLLILDTGSFRVRST